MKLVNVEVDHFKNILKSGSVAVQPEVTCVVGKNEGAEGAQIAAGVKGGVAAAFPSYPKLGREPDSSRRTLGSQSASNLG